MNLNKIYDTIPHFEANIEKLFSFSKILTFFVSFSLSFFGSSLFSTCSGFPQSTLQHRSIYAWMFLLKRTYGSSGIVIMFLIGIPKKEEIF